MSVLPNGLQLLIDELGYLPGVGPRSAERYGFYLLKNHKSQSQKLAKALQNLHSSIKVCPKTFMLIDADQTYSPIYQDKNRDKQQVAVVEEPLDVAALESTGVFKGTYHVLGGAISPVDGVGPQQLHIKELVSRIKEDKVKEVIIATNPSIEGESTALYVSRRLMSISGLKITRLARGLPSGIDIEYADQITLAKALEDRQAL